MSVFVTNKVESLRKKSQNAVSVFQKTVADLSSVNDQIRTETQLKQEKVKALNKEINDLSSIQIGNTKLIDKINEFLSV